MNNILYLMMKHCFFLKIKNGEKTKEYREYKDYWIKRIKNKNKIIFIDGYKKDAERIEAEILNISVINGKNTDLNIDKKVFCIELKNIKERK